MKNIKAIFFDLHGTILLSNDLSAAWEDWINAFYNCMVRNGLSIVRSEFVEHLNDFFVKPQPNFNDEGFTSFERRLKKLGEKLGLKLDRGTIRGIVDEVISVWHRDMYLDRDSHNVLQGLRSKFRLALITNWDHTPRIYKLLSEFGLAGYFDEVIISDEVGVAKPEARIFEIAMNRMGLAPFEVVHVGDDLVDIEGSINAGIYPIQIIRESNSKGWDYFPSTSSITSEGRTIHQEKFKKITLLKELLEIFS
jgi:putative hydrolase of the HAD superfamily